MDLILKFFIFFIILIFNLVINDSSFAKSKEKEKNSSDREFLFFNGQILAEYRFDTLNSKKYQITDEKNTRGYLNLEARYNFHIYKGLSIKNSLLLRPVGRRTYDYGYAGHGYNSNGNHSNNDFYGKENYLARDFHNWDYGLFLDELGIQYENSFMIVGIGKIDPYFGWAHDKNRFHGFEGTDIANEYKLDDKINLFLGFKSEILQLRADFFFDDTTFMSGSLFKQIGLDKSIGGAGNTGKPNNFVLSADVTLDKRKMHFAFRNLNVSNKYNEVAEYGYLFAYEEYRPLNTYFGLIPMLETAFFHNFEGVRNRDIWYTTASLPFYYGGFNFTMSETLKFDFEPNFNMKTSSITQFTAGYKFKIGILIDIAQKFHIEYIKTPTATGAVKEKFTYHSWIVSMGYFFRF